MRILGFFLGMIACGYLQTDGVLDLFDCGFWLGFCGLIWNCVGIEPAA